MAESHVTPTLRDLVWLLPSHDDEAQLARLEQIAKAQGLGLDNRLGQRDGSAPKGAGWLTVFDHPGAVSSAEPSRLLIVLPEKVEDLLERLEAGQDTSNGALVEASVLLAFANYLIEQGARSVIQLDADRSANETPSGDLPMGHQHDCPLGQFASLPVPVGAKAVWGADTFLYTTRGQRTGGTPQTDLTGIGRILVHGPGIVLTPGTWQLEVTFAVDTDGDAIDLRFDWGGSAAYTTLHQKVKQTGRYSLEMTREWTENEGAEFRIWIEHGLLHGSMEMLEAKLSRVA